MRIISITILEGSNEGKNFTLATDIPILIGRSSSAHICLVDDNLVSRKHAYIICEESSLFIHDLNSKNGTYINGEKIECPTLLKNGDIITIGRTNLKIGVMG